MKTMKIAAAIGLVALAGLGPLRAQGVPTGYVSRFHIRAGATLVNLAATSTLSGELDRWGFGDDFTEMFLGVPVLFEYPDVSSRVPVDIELSYSVDRRFTVGLAVCGLGNATGAGWDSLGAYDDWQMGFDVRASGSGRAYFLNAAYEPAPKRGRRIGGRAGLGVGICDIEASFETGLERWDMTRQPLCAQVFAGVDLWLFRYLTLGATAQYRYVPEFPAFEIEASSNVGGVTRTYAIPASSFGLGGLTVGIGIGLHF